MKLIFASALVATVAVAIKPISVPEYLAGFIYGMTGNNHLDLINTCVQNADVFAVDLKNTIENLKEEKKLFFDFDLKKLRTDKDQVKMLCKGMDSDLNQIETWAQQLKNPKELAKTAGQSYLIHRKEI